MCTEEYVKTCAECSWVLRFLNVSMLCYVLPLVLWLIVWLYSYRQRKNTLYLKPATNNLVKLVSLFGFVLAAFFMQYAVGCFEIHHPESGGYAPTYEEELLDSFFRAVRTFGVPEHFTDFVADFRTMLETVDKTASRSEVLHGGVVFYVVLVDVAILFMGSSLILGLFNKLFPRFRLACANLNPEREKYYFSGLNPQSLMLAKSMIATRRAEKKFLRPLFWRPLIVFTDAYLDDEEETSTELLLEAKQLGAVCLRDDLAHVQKARYGKRSYFLIEEKESDNLPALMDLVSEKNLPYIQSATIYLMVQSDLHVRLEQRVRQQLSAMIAQSKKKRTPPTIIPINAYRNLVNNLMVDVPLYEPLVNTDKKRLSVTILGNGAIGTEALLSTYWFGQILVDMGGERLACPLDIHVVSKDEEEAFYAKVDYICPEIRRTTDPKDTILNWNNTEKNAPYCEIIYHKADVKRGSMSEDAAWLKSDYYIVALGNDADNIAVAEKLRCCVGKRHAEQEEKADRAVIAYVVYDADLCDALNADHRVEYNVYMYAFGSLRDVYSYDNIFMTKNYLRAKQTGKAYDQKHKNPEDACKKSYEDLPNKIDEKMKKDNVDAVEAGYRVNYNTWSSMARGMHLKYKVFSLGWITASRFTEPTRDEVLRKEQEACQAYLLMCALDAHQLANSSDEKTQEYEQGKDRLAWLEKRRWNACLRSAGYSYSRNRIDTLKLHNCLVEARGPKKGEGFSYEGGPTDKLDQAGLDSKENYKKYDYPEQETGKHFTIKQLLEIKNADEKSGTLSLPGLTLEALRKRCEENTDEQVFRGMTKNGEDWIISEEYLAKWLGNDIYATIEEKAKKLANASVPPEDKKET